MFFFEDAPDGGLQRGQFRHGAGFVQRDVQGQHVVFAIHGPGVQVVYVLDAGQLLQPGAYPLQVHVLGCALQDDAQGLPDVTSSLQGQIAGVSVNNVSSTFGAAPQVTIRGNSSIHGDNKPLWVVDGVVLEDLINVSSDDLTSGNLSTLLSICLLTLFFNLLSNSFI